MGKKVTIVNANNAILDSNNKRVDVQGYTPATVPSGADTFLEENVADRNVFTDLEGDISSYTKYGVTPRLGYNYNLARAENQTRKEQFINMAKQVGTVVSGEAISGVGSLFEIMDSVGEELKGGTADFNNLLMTWGEELQQFGRDKAPIYQEKPNKAFNVEDFAWWMSNMPSVASSIGMMIPGYGVGYGITKGMAALSKAVGSARLAGKIAKSAGLAGQIGMAATMRNAENLKESMMVANDLRDQVIRMPDDEFARLATNPEVVEDYLAATGKPFNKDNFADYVAAKGAWRNYAVDAGNIVFDFMQVAPLFKGLRMNTRAFTNNSKVINASLKAAGKSTMTKAESFLNNAAHIGMGVGSREVVTEGIEEVVNHIASQEGMHYGKFLMDRAEDNEFSDRFNTYLKDPKMWEQGFWGAVGGGVFAGGTRALSSLQYAIGDKTDPYSNKNRINEINSRQTKLANAFSKMETVRKGLNPYVKDEAGNPMPIIGDEEGQLIIDSIINEVGTDIGLAASEAANIELALTQFESPEFIEGIKNIADDVDSVQPTIDKIKAKVLEVESKYKPIYSNIMARTDVKDYLKGRIINDALFSELEMSDHNAHIGRISEKINGYEGNTVFSSIQDWANENDIDLQSSKDKVSLNILKKQLNSQIEVALNNGNLNAASDLGRIVSEIDNRLESIKDSNTVNEQTLLSKGITPIHLSDNAALLGHSIKNELLESDLKEMLVDTPKYANKLDKQFKDDAAILYKDIADSFDNDLAKAKTPEDVDKIRNMLNLVSKRMPPKSPFIKKLSELDAKAKNQRKSLEREAKIKEREAKSEAKSTDEGSTVVEEPVAEEPEVTEPVDEEDNSEPREETPTEETPVVEETSEEEPKKEPTPPKVPKQASEEPEEEKDVPVNNNPKPVPAEEEELSEEEEKELQKEKNKANLDLNNEGHSVTAPLGDLALFVSSIYNVRINRDALDDNNNLVLTKEKAVAFNKIFNNIDVGSELIIKYDEDKQDAINNYRKPLAVYDKEGNKLFHLSEVGLESGIFYFDHKGIRYTTGSNWTNYVYDQLALGKFQEQLGLLIQYRINEIRDNDSANSEVLLRLKQLGIEDVVNMNRENDKIEFSNNKFAEAIDHLSKVLTYKVDLSEDNVLPDIEFIRNELINWHNRIVSDLQHTIEVRSHFINDATLELSTNVVSKTPGSFVVGDLYTTLNNVVGKTTEDYNVPLMFGLIEAPNTVSAINGVEFQDLIVERVTKGIPYIPLYLGMVDGSPVYKAVPTQYTSLGMKEVPSEISEYNNKLMDHIIELLNSDLDYRQMEAALRPYIRASHIQKTDNDGVLTDEYVTLITSEKMGNKDKKESEKIDRTVKLRKVEGKWQMFRHSGKTAMKETSMRIDGLPIVRRNVALEQDGHTFSMNNEPFTDFEGTKYNSYTEFLIKTGAVVTDYGAIRDSEGNLLSNAEAFSRTNKIGQDLRITVGGSPKVENVKVEDNKNPKSVLSFANSITPHPYTNLFKLIDDLGIVFDSTKREAQPENKKTAYASYNKQSNILSLYERFDTLTSRSAKVRHLAHEGIHRTISTNITNQHRNQLLKILHKLLNSLDEFAKDNIRDRLTQKELEILEGVNGKVGALDEMAFDQEEVITLALTNPTVAKALNLVESVESTPNKPKSLAKELLDIILDIINQVFGKTLLTDVTNVLEDILLNSDEITTDDTNNTPSEPTGDIDQDIIEGSRDVFSSIDNSYVPQIPNALDYIKTLNKEDRALVRDALNNQTLIFKCK